MLIEKVYEKGYSSGMTTQQLAAQEYSANYEENRKAWEETRQLRAQITESFFINKTTNVG